MKERVSIRLLGPMVCSSKSGETSSFATSKVLELLALLVFYRGQVVYRDDIISRLWPNSYGSNDRNRLSVTCYLLRKSLNDIGGGEDLILSDKSSLWLDEKRFDSDTWRVDDLYLSLNSKSSAERLLVLEHILAEYRGTFASGCRAIWLNEVRSAYQNILIHVMKELLENFLAIEDRIQAQSLLRTAVLLNVQPNALLDEVSRSRSVATGLAGSSSFLNEIKQGLDELSFGRDPLSRAVVVERPGGYLDDTSSNQILAPTVILCVVSEVAKEELARVCSFFDVELDDDGVCAIVPNIRLANRIANEVLERVPISQVMLHQITLERPIPKEIKRWIKFAPAGAVYATGAAAAALSESKIDVVRERPAIRLAYGYK